MATSAARVPVDADALGVTAVPRCNGTLFMVLPVEMELETGCAFWEPVAHFGNRLRVWTALRTTRL